MKWKMLELDSKNKRIINVFSEASWCHLFGISCFWAKAANSPNENGGFLG
jgi:hypothetical protein